MKIIGKLQHPHWRAELSTDGRWTCTNKDIEVVLNLEYSPQRDHSPAQGAYGYTQLHQAAKDLGTRIMEEAVPPEQSDEVY